MLLYINTSIFQRPSTKRCFTQSQPMGALVIIGDGIDAMSMKVERPLASF